MMKKQKKFQGVLVPAIVPLDDVGKINEIELRRLIDWLINNGVSGFFPNGTTGEFVRFTSQERREIIRIYAEQTAGRVPIIAGSSEENINEVIEVCGEYSRLGCMAAAICPPYYFKLSQDSLVEYYTQLANRTDLDILIYNIPQMTIEISIESIKEICNLSRIIGIKDSSNDFARFLNLMSQVCPMREDFIFLTGRDEFLVPAMEMGADGGTNATAGVIPEVFMKMYHLAREGQVEVARELQKEILPFLRCMLVGCEYPEGFRVAMELRGFRMGKCRQPVSRGQQKYLLEVSRKLSHILKKLQIDS